MDALFSVINVDVDESSMSVKLVFFSYNIESSFLEVKRNTVGWERRVRLN